jgi:hypothetical protein
MLFTILIGVLGAAFYSARMLFIKLRYRLGGGKVEALDKKIPLVIFSDGKQYWKVFAPICKELSARGQEVVYYTMSEDDPALSAQLPGMTAEFIGEDNRAFTKLNFLKANVVFSTTPGLDVYQWKRSKDVDFYVHIPHAPNDITLYRMFGIDYYDSILLSGDYQVKQIRQMEAKRELPAKDLKLVGIPYMDDMAARLDSVGAAEAHERTVLLAPSWGDSALFGVYGGKIIEKLLETGYHVIVRPHPQSFKSEKELMDKLMEKFPNSDKLEWNRDSDNFEVLRRSDILISDFSGVTFDFSLIYDKPVIYTTPNFDLGPYDAWWMEEPLWTTTILPHIGAELTEDKMDSLKELIDTCIEDPRYAEGRKKAKAETWVNAGAGAKAVADYLQEKLATLTEKKEG